MANLTSLSPQPASNRTALFWRITNIPHYLGSFQEPCLMERLPNPVPPPPSLTPQGAACWDWVSVQALELVASGTVSLHKIPAPTPTAHNWRMVGAGGWDKSHLRVVPLPKTMTPSLGTLFPWVNTSEPQKTRVYTHLIFQAVISPLLFPFFYSSFFEPFPVYLIILLFPPS